MIYKQYLEILGIQPWTNRSTFGDVFVDGDGLRNKWNGSEKNLNRVAISSMTLKGVMIRRTRDDLFDGVHAG